MAFRFATSGNSLGKDLADEPDSKSCFYHTDCDMYGRNYRYHYYTDEEDNKSIMEWDQEYMEPLGPDQLFLESTFGWKSMRRILGTSQRVPGYGIANLLLFAVANKHEKLANRILDYNCNNWAQLAFIGRVRIKDASMERLGRTLSLWARTDSYHAALMTGQVNLANRIWKLLPAGASTRRGGLEATFDNSDSRWDENSIRLSESNEIISTLIADFQGYACPHQSSDSSDGSNLRPQ